MIKYNNKKSGMTLMELLVVIVIIGILVAFGLIAVRLMSKDENENFISCSISLRLLEPKVLRMAISRLRWAMK